MSTDASELPPHDADTIIGMVEAHPTKPGEVVLRNVGPNDWIMALEGEPVVTLPCRRQLGKGPDQRRLGNAPAEAREQHERTTSDL
jgi:hypothetical protein